MSSLVIKVGSLLVKTLSKPIANRIKAQAREHERFRRVCVNVAQGIHRWDMRFRLGLLQDTAAIERQIAKDAAEHNAKKHKLEITTVKTEAQMKADEAAEAKRRDGGEKPKESSSSKKPKIRPLSEAKAIDLGANFVSESFLFVVGVGLIVFENWRRGRQETSRREDVADRLSELENSEEKARKYYAEALVKLEDEVLKLRAKTGIAPGDNHRILPKPVWDLADKDDTEDENKGQGWLSWVPKFRRKALADDETKPAPTSAANSDPRSSQDPSPPRSSWSSVIQIPRRHARDISPNAAESLAEVSPNSPEETPDVSKPSKKG